MFLRMEVFKWLCSRIVYVTEDCAKDHEAAEARPTGVFKFKNKYSHSHSSPSFLFVGFSSIWQLA